MSINSATDPGLRAARIFDLGTAPYPDLGRTLDFGHGPTHNLDPGPIFYLDPRLDSALRLTLGFDSATGQASDRYEVDTRRAQRFRQGSTSSSAALVLSCSMLTIVLINLRYSSAKLNPKGCQHTIDSTEVARDHGQLCYTLVDLMLVCSSIML
ncbi:hypothetical protein EVAR_52645_1 [Eumeta japonica]|uniref:Uncharacterized protein n=1 Tax=Eumeta variegata TaxID=151549 RepID=A0A4C1Y0I5_EUMVA|nr:hypothetical protein EVAR_52645_1 [Eumeta japonica]